MKNKWIVASALIVALIMVCGASLFATWQGMQMVRGTGIRINPVNWTADQVNVQATQEKTLQVESPVTLSVQTFQGNITVKSGQAGKVIVKSEITAWGNSDADAQAALKDITVVIEQKDKDIKVSVDQAAVVDMLHIGPRGGAVNFTITVPPETAVTLNSTQGSLSLTGTSGNSDLKTEFGNLSLTDVTGDIKGKSGNGDVTAENIGAGGLISLSSDFGALSVQNAKGSDITLATSNGSMTGLKNVQATGLLKITTEFGDIRLVGGLAKVAKIHSNNGAIDLEKITIDDIIAIKSDFGNLTVQDVNAHRYDLSSQNGKISLDGAQGAITAHSDFGSVDVLHARNATIDLLSKNGAVNFSGSLGDGPHVVESQFGNIQVTLPSESALKLDLQTDFGKITSDFSMTISGTMDSNHWSGTINGGGATLNITTKNGNIAIRSSK